MSHIALHSASDRGSNQMAHLVLVDVHSGPYIAETAFVPVLVAHRGANDSRSVVFVAFFDIAGIGVVVICFVYVDGVPFTADCVHVTDNYGLDTVQVRRWRSTFGRKVT